MDFILSIIGLGLFFGFTMAHDDFQRVLCGLPLIILMLISFLASIH
jgi:hypothetical protein